MKQNPQQKNHQIQSLLTQVYSNVLSTYNLTSEARKDDSSAVVSVYFPVQVVVVVGRNEGISFYREKGLCAGTDGSNTRYTVSDV